MKSFICIECNETQEGSAIHHDDNGDDLCGICADVSYVGCTDCYNLIKRDKVKHEYKGDALCGECRDLDYIKCADCSEILHTVNDCEYDDENGNMVCEECSESYCYDEVCDCTIRVNNAVSAIHVSYSGSRRQTEVVTHSDNATCIYDGYYTDEARDELFICCESCDEYVDRDNAYYTDNYGYCESCYPGNGSDDDMNWKGMGNDIDSITFIDCISTRKYGVEIECMNAANSSHENDTVFESKSDGSLNNSGCEFVSPILQGDDGFEELRKMCKILSSNCAIVDESCGLHIHIDLSDFDENDLARLFYFVQKLEPITRKFIPDYRNRNSFCGFSLEGIDFKKTYKDGYFQGLERYSAYNFRAYNSYKTLEIRLHQGTIDYDEIRNWISLHLAVIDYVKRRENVNEHTEKTFRELLPIIARDVSTFYANKREQYHPMTPEERAVESSRELQTVGAIRSDRLQREREAQETSAETPAETQELVDNYTRETNNARGLI